MSTLNPTQLFDIPITQLCNILGTDLQTGLSQQTAVQRNLLEGDNTLPSKQKIHPIILFLAQITNWFSILLWVGCFLSIIIYILAPDGNEANLFLAFVLIVVILITGTITYMQKAKSQEIMEKFKDMLPQSCLVIRNGNLVSLPAAKLVRGDLVQIKNGEGVPADLRIIVSQNLKVDNSSITGETNLLLRTISPTSKSLLETKNVAFFGTYCRMGRGKGIVIGTAANTLMASIADLASQQKIEKSPLQLQLDRFVLMITIIACSLGVIFILLSKIVVGYSILDCMVFGIGIIVANVPQGILACVTISLAITAKKLAQKNVLVKNLQSVETLGSTSCICSDKTGTLTMNKMTVSNIWNNGKIHSPQSCSSLYSEDKDVELLMHCASLSLSAKFEQEDRVENGQLAIAAANVIGDASQTAILKYLQSFISIRTLRFVNYTSAKDMLGQPYFQPFDSTLKYSYGVYSNNSQKGKSKFCVYIKGAPEKIWLMCSGIRVNGNNNSIDKNWSNQFKKTNENLGSAGQRVLGFAYKQLDQQLYPSNYLFKQEGQGHLKQINLTGFTFIGLISLVDPPKPTVVNAINKCRASGVKVIMLTGDQQTTAVAISKKIGIFQFKTNIELQKQGYSKAQALEKANAVAISGAQIDKAFEMGEESGQQILQYWLHKPEIIFSRTTPLHKLRIVQACQDLGHIVAVTGDGVNDAPAIKKANIGISMGISGSDVTKDAADMILLDDDFSSIIEGIQQGRKVFDNLKKTIVYLLTSNATEIWPFVVMIILQIPLPVSNIFMLCICVGTDIYPAISLAYQQPELDIMTRRPRKQGDHLVSMSMMVHSYGLMGSIATAAGFYTYFIIMELYGFPLPILISLLSKQGIVPLGASKLADMNFNQVVGYVSDQRDLGNPYLPNNCTSATFSDHFPSWTKFSNSRYDLRFAYNICCPPPNQSLYCSLFDWPQQVLDTISPITNAPVAYTTEALLYAQSGYFAAVVFVQACNIFACKTRKVSFTYSSLNEHIFIGIGIEVVLMIVLLYVPGINTIFGGRPLQIPLLGVPGLFFAMLLLFWEECRKYLINNNFLIFKKEWFEKHVYW